jgi:hypothetical protein
MIKAFVYRIDQKRWPGTGQGLHLSAGVPQVIYFPGQKAQNMSSDTGIFHFGIWAQVIRYFADGAMSGNESLDPQIPIALKD